MTTLRHSPQDAHRRIFHQEFEPLIRPLHSFALRLTGNAHDAEDLVQETLSRLWRSLGQYTEGTNAKAWFFRICQHLFINDWRKRKSQPYKVDYEDIVVYHNEDDPVTQRYQGLQTEDADAFLGDEVTKAINALPTAFRAVVLLDLEDFTYKEIAALLDLPINTVRTRLHRARKILRKGLEAYGQSHGYKVADNETGMDSDGDFPGDPALNK